MRIDIKNNVKIYLISIIIVAITIIGTIFNFEHTYQVTKQDYTEPVYGSGSLDGWSLQFDMYTNIEGENQVDKTNSIESIDYEYTGGNQYKYITFQVSYNYTGLTEIEANNIEIIIPKYKIGKTLEDELYQPMVNIAAGDTSLDFEWTYQEEDIDGKPYFVFTNNNDLSNEDGQNRVNGMFQISYAISGDDVYIRYDNVNHREIINNKIFNATLKLKDDDNFIKSNDKSVSLFLPKTIYNIEEQASKLQSLDGLPTGDYIWVKYNANALQRDKLRCVSYSRNYSYNGYSIDYNNYLRKELLSDNCIIFDSGLNKLEKDENGYYWVPAQYNGEFSSYKSNIRWVYYVGYPRQEFNNLEITENSDAFLTYADLKKEDDYSGPPAYLTTHELEQGNSSSITVNLSDFDVEFPDDPYKISKLSSDLWSVSSLHSSDKMSADLISDSSDDIKNYIVPALYYTGTPLNVKIGDDRGYIESLDGTSGTWLTDNDYHFTKVEFPRFFNGNGKRIGSYEVKFFVRYANTNEYVLYKTATDENAGVFDTSTYKRFDLSNENVVGFYFEIYNLQESVLTGNSQERIDVYVSYHKNNLYSIVPDGKGYMHNIVYMDVYDTNNNLLNNMTEESYFNTSYTNELKQKDMNEYGRYLERDYTTSFFLPSREGYTIKQSIKNPVYNTSQWNSNLYLYAIKRDMTGYKSKKITKIDMYDLLPQGVYVDADQDIEITPCSGNNCGDSTNYQTKYKLNGVEFTSNEELEEFINDHTSTEIVYNWKNTGRTWVHISGDFSAFDFQSNDYDSYILKAMIKVNIPYESITEYGLNYTNYSYINAEPGGKDIEEAYNGYGYIFQDNGKYDPDAKDINGNGRQTDGLMYSSNTITLLEAYSSQSTLSKTARAYTLDDEGNKIYNSEWTEETLVNINGLYEYKNKMYNTTESPISNVVIYDNLEAYFYNSETGEYESSGDGWKGIFNGVDTSFLTAKGYIVKAYYSTNDKAGILRSNGFLNGDWKLLSTLDEDDYKTVKSLAFEILDLNENPAIIPPDTTLYVTIQMKAPPTTSSKIAYNTFWSQWNVVDNSGNIVDEPGGTYSLPPEIEMNTADINIEVIDEEGNYLKDIPFQIIDSTGNVAYEFESGTNTIHIEDVFANGATYNIVQQSAKDGYIKSNDIEFTADKTIDNQTITIINKTTKLSIEKKDTSNNYVVGSILQIRDEAGQIIEEWTTNNGPHNIDGKLKADTNYILKEISTVRGYAIAEDITFKVNSDGNRQTIQMTEPDTKVTIHNVDDDGNNLSGTKLRIKDSNNNIVLSWTTTDDSYQIIRQLEAGKTYTLEVEKPTDGYAYSLSRDFTVPVNGDNIDVTIENTKTKIEVTKKDEQNNNQSGVTLQIIDKENNNVVREWVTTEEKELITGLIADKEYILHEEKSVDGYSYADDIIFRMNRDIGTQQLVITNYLTNVEIKKLNTNNELLEGAILQIKDNNTVIDEWITTNDSIHSIIGVLVADKTYTLHEVSAPKGYLTAKDKQIKINKNNEITEIEMIDVKNKLKIINLDETTKEPLEGATLQILDQEGNTLKEWISTIEGNDLEGVLECNKEYTLHVLNPAPGYIIPNDLIFTISDDENDTKIEISELKTNILIRKQNMKNDLLTGATLQILNSNKDIIHEFTTNDSIENIIGKLNINEVYTLHELKAPNNYEIAEDMMFKITDNGQLMLYKNKDYEELDNNTMIVIDKEKIINPATKYPVYIEFFAIIIILSIGILALIPKKYSE